MKIAIIGTHCTGKTTLCHELATALRSRGKRVAIVEEMSRICPFPVNETATFDSQYWILASQITHELESAKDNDIVICDRGVVDNYVYLLRKFPHKSAALTPLVLDHCKSYDLIIRTIPERTAETDGFRSTDDGFRNEIDRMLTVFLGGHRIPHEIVIGDDRIRQILEHIP